MGEGSNVAPGADERFGALANACDRLVFVTQPGGRMLWTNETFVRATGYRAEDFWFETQKNPFLHPDDLARVGAFIAAFAASDAKQSEPIENRFFDRWGRIHSYRSVICKTTWNDAPALLFVTGEIEADAPSSRSDDSYKALVESANDGILKVSVDGRIHFANRRFIDLVKLDAVSLRDRTFFDLLRSEDVAHARETFAECARGGGSCRFESGLVTADGNVVEVDVNASVLDGVDGGLLLAIVRDVTEARRLEAKMREAQRLESLGVFAGGMAHDVNNLMTAVLVSATRAESLVEPRSELALLLRSMLLAGRQAAGLSKALLAYIGQAPTSVEVTDVRSLVVDVIALTRSLLPKSVQVIGPGEGEPITVLADRAHLSQLAMNLVTNAAEAMRDRKGAVRVTVDEVALDEGATAARRWVLAEPKPGTYVRLCVTDRGVGIPANAFDRIFDPFFTTKATGRGLGLSAVLGIVRTHHGALAIESTEGRGSTFEVFLRRDERAS